MQSNKKFWSMALGLLLALALVPAMAQERKKARRLPRLRPKRKARKAGKPWRLSLRRKEKTLFPSSN